MPTPRPEEAREYALDHAGKSNDMDIDNLWWLSFTLKEQRLGRQAQSELQLGKDSVEQRR